VVQLKTKRVRVPAKDREKTFYIPCPKMTKWNFGLDIKGRG
jgi:hypothetical protein